MNNFTAKTGNKIALRDAGWTWNRKLRRWEKGDVTAKTMYDALRMERTVSWDESPKPE